MKKLLSILLALSLSTSAFADFEGFPCATNNIWQQCRSFGAISQLWYAVQERCLVLTNMPRLIDPVQELVAHNVEGESNHWDWITVMHPREVYPLNIEESWVVQIGYTNEVVSMVFGDETVDVINRLPYYITVQTTNQVCDLTLPVTNYIQNSSIIPLRSGSTTNTMVTTNYVYNAPFDTLDSATFINIPNFAISYSFAGEDSGRFEWSGPAAPVEYTPHSYIVSLTNTYPSGYPQSIVDSNFWSLPDFNTTFPHIDGQRYRLYVLTNVVPVTVSLSNPLYSDWRIYYYNSSGGDGLEYATYVWQVNQVVSNNEYTSATVMITNEVGYVINYTNNDLVLSFPVTHEFISTLDARMFQITPFFVNTNRASIAPWAGDTVPTFNNYFTRYGTAVYSNYVDGLVPTEWPYHCKASVMKNAGIGYITNLVYDSFSNVINGSAWFTRQPAVTNAWALWQAVRVVEDSVLVSGMSDAAVNGTYVKMVVGDGRLGGWWPDGLPYSALEINPNEPIYMKLDLSAVITSKKYNFYYIPPQPYLWCIDKLTGVGANTYSYLTNSWKIVKNTTLDGPTLANITTGATNSIDLSGDIYTWRDMTSTLITSNDWRDIAPWGIWYGYFNVETYFDGLGTNNIGNFDNHPAIVGASVVATLTSNWVCRSLANYDVRYYDEGPRPFYRVLINGTNAVNLNINIGGTAFIDFNEPDFMGEQVVEYASEFISLVASNTPSSYRWFSIESSTNTYVTGEAPAGSVITLMWTNSHTFDRLPYRLEAKDLDERWKYLRELVWTTVPYEWVETMEGSLGYMQDSSTNIEVHAGGIYNSGWTYFNYWTTYTDWDNYKAPFTNTARSGWDSGDFAGYKDPKVFESVYSNYPFANITYPTPVSTNPPMIWGDAHSYFTKESKVSWRSQINFNVPFSSLIYQCDIRNYAPLYRGWFDFGLLFWGDIFGNPDYWYYDMTASHPTYVGAGGNETGIGYLGPEVVACNDYYAWFANNVTPEAAPGVPYYNKAAEQGFTIAGYASKVAPQHLNTEPLYGNRLTFESQVYVGVFAPDVYRPLQLLDTQNNLFGPYTSAASYSITITNILPDLPNNMYVSEEYQEQVVWRYTLPSNLVGSIWNIYSQEVSRAVLTTNLIVFTTNDVVIRWLHWPEDPEDPAILESNTYYSATNIPQFEWGMTITKTYYTTNIFDIPYNPVVGWTNYPGMYPSYWDVQPTNLVDGTEYEYATITNYTTYDVVSYTTVVWSGFNEYYSMATTTNIPTNGVWYYGTDGYIHTRADDWFGREYISFYGGPSESDYTSASNRLVDLGLDAYIPNLQYKTVAYTQTVYNVANLCTLTVIPVGERKVVGTRDCNQENGSQIQIHETNFSFTATAPECLIKWNFKRK